MITIYTKTDSTGYLPTVHTDSQEETNKIIKLYTDTGFKPTFHKIYEDGREEWFLIA